MKHQEWFEVGRKQIGLWPNQPWEEGTMAAAAALFAEVPLGAALQALEELAAEGREFAPPPGVVLTHSLQIVIASAPALPPPDSTRALTPEEQDRANRIAAGLSNSRAALVRATWLLFARHAAIAIHADETAEIAAQRITACDGKCALVASRCRAGHSSRAISPWLDDCCSAGKPLFEAWREACFDLVTSAFGSMQQEAAL